ncbi:MAG: DNA-binding protein, partial [Lachnospiraceae bacterium]|nr:DNA-binding protein [Lachnospiraceae bacterium]
MEEFVKRSLLYDFYGDLLTEHQKEIYGAYVMDNLSYAEIAQEYDISRQGV